MYFITVYICYFIYLKQIQTQMTSISSFLEEEDNYYLYSVILCRLAGLKKHNPICNFFLSICIQIEESLQMKNDSSHLSSADVPVGAVRHNNSDFQGALKLWRQQDKRCSQIPRRNGK